MAVDDPHGWWHVWELANRGEWEPDTHEWMRRWLRPGDLFVDVGAWIGITASWAHALGAEVVAFEPDPVAYRELIKRVPDAYDHAITIRGGLRKLARNPKEGGEYGDSCSHIDDHGIVVTSVTLPGILRYYRRPALVKIDIEGYEVALMRSLGPWLAKRGIPLQVSCHGRYVSAASLADYGNVEWPEGPNGEVRAWT
jgi:FkbM family methyltransferase